MEDQGHRLLSRRRVLGALAPVLAALLGFAAFACISARSFAQNTTTRVVQGKVVDKAGAALKGATVYLKDSHTLSVKSYIAVDDGTYRFGQLAQNTDYEVWAESAGKKSATRNISSFDNRKEFDITLKIDK